MCALCAMSIKSNRTACRGQITTDKIALSFAMLLTATMAEITDSENHTADRAVLFHGNGSDIVNTALPRPTSTGAMCKTSSAMPPRR